MARVSPIRRLAAAYAALALAGALLASPPGLAASPELPGNPPSQEIAASSALVGVVPSTTKRGPESLLVSLRALAAPRSAEPVATGQGKAPRGGEAPALLRWRLAHGTSTSSP